jgi:hypothetical protein
VHHALLLEARGSTATLSAVPLFMRTRQPDLGQRG